MADPVSEQAQPPPAQALGDFMLLNRIGRGSQGEVWLAEDSLGTPFAEDQFRRVASAGRRSEFFELA